jgi:hypothetical protein
VNGYDAYSRRLLAVALAVDPPSYHAAMLVLRECVRRHQRLPQTVVIDGGAEFAGLYFETLLAGYECTKKTRPGAQPRRVGLRGLRHHRGISSIIRGSIRTCPTTPRD